MPIPLWQVQYRRRGCVQRRGPTFRDEEEAYRYARLLIRHAARCGKRVDVRVVRTFAEAFAGGD